MRIRPKALPVDKEGQFRPSSPKTEWHPLSLQHLKPSQFVDVVNRILDGRYEVISGTLRGSSGKSDMELLHERLRSSTDAVGELL